MNKHQGSREQRRDAAIARLFGGFNLISPWDRFKGMVLVGCVIIFSLCAVTVAVCHFLKSLS